MAKTEVSTAKLHSVAKGLEEDAAKFRAATAKLYETGLQLDKMWDGEASQTFLNTFKNDQQNFEALAKLLDSYAAILNENAGIYAKAESDAKNIVSKGMARG